MALAGFSFRPRHWPGGLWGRFFTYVIHQICVISTDHIHMAQELAEVRQQPTVPGQFAAIGELLSRQDRMEDMMLIALVQERIDALEVAQHRYPTPQTEADLQLYRGIAARLSARIRKRQARWALISRLTAIANLRLHWRIWRRPLAVPEPEEIATDI